MKDPLSQRARLCLVFLSVGLMALSLAACGGGGGTSASTGASGDSGGEPQRGGTVRIAEETEIDTLDPVKGVLLSDANALEQMIEGLFQVNSDGEAKPWLVEKYETSKDLKEWTFHLRPGVTFADGSKLDSADVVFSLDTVRESEIWSSLYEFITSVKATSPSTVVVKTNVAYPAFPYLLAIFPAGIVPAEYGGMSEDEFARHPVGTGPFMFSSWKQGGDLTLVRNPDYWKPDLPYLDKVVYVTAPEDNSRVAQLKAGDLDVIAKPSWAQLSGLESTPGLTIAKAEDSQVGSIFINGKRPLFKDPRAREAVSLAVDRQGITEAALKGQGQPAYAWYPLAMRFADLSLKPPAQDAAKAKQLLEAAESATGEDGSITLIYSNEDEYHRTVAQIAQENLNEAGFDVSLEPRDAASANEETAAGNYDLALGIVVTIVPDPVEWYGYYVGTEALSTFAPLDVTGKLIDEAANEPDEQKREDLYHQVQARMVDENYLVNISNLPLVYGVSDSVQNLSVEWWGIVRFAEAWTTG